MPNHYIKNTLYNTRRLSDAFVKYNQSEYKGIMKRPFFAQFVLIFKYDCARIARKVYKFF